MNKFGLAWVKITTLDQGAFVWYKCEVSWWDKHLVPTRAHGLRDTIRRTLEYIQSMRVLLFFGSGLKISTVLYRLRTVLDLRRVCTMSYGNI